MTDRSELPIPDFDHLPENGLANRIRTLDADGLQTLLDYERAHANRLPIVMGLQTLLDYERAHANRLPIVMLMENRLSDLRRGEAEPTGGDPAGAQPETPSTPDRGSPVPDQHQQANNQPLRHGVSDQTPNRPTR